MSRQLLQPANETRPDYANRTVLALATQWLSDRVDTRLLLRQAKVLLGRDYTDRVGVAHPAAPALNTDNVVALVDDSELETVGDAPLETAVHILLPDFDIEVGLLLGEEEWPYAAVKVRILRSRVSMARQLCMLDLPSKQLHYV